MTNYVKIVFYKQAPCDSCRYCDKDGDCEFAYNKKTEREMIDGCPGVDLEKLEVKDIITVEVENG